MSDYDKHSRLNKFEKRRKNTKGISILLIIAGILIIVLLGIWLFGGGNEEEENAEQPDSISEDIVINDDNENNNTEDESSSDEGNSDSENTDESADETEEDSNDDQNSDEESNQDNNEDIEAEEVEPSDDNVSRAYTGNWEPIGTEQEGPHTTTYEEGTADRKELKQAASLATGLAEDDMIEWWYENGGDQKVIATVSNNAQTETYRVYLSWIDEEGWKPTKVEELIENDRKNQ
ncbi:hypothetical protein CIL05_13440 [Virgibacillus profundi]|uniref:DUF1510 domain-containing protein n=1 Tax=Virgibacillus profundi TaxID=2024555 RepID=A0A2A2IB79_9BACI|nr:YrrS family protein [Virgibacillus profundi]PAV28979.1 hypothetical protein CIL05_13440 [Virgibacillus profundi]PXY53147.1 DUF1510 domain-containing protein [Virgibacillus profundi]